MVSATSHSLTQRQRDVMERIDRRVPIKVIADELGLSATRVNQHIRALKDIYGADSLAELVECHRASEASIVAGTVDPAHTPSDTRSGDGSMRPADEQLTAENGGQRGRVRRLPRGNNASMGKAVMALITLIILGAASLAMAYQIANS